MPVVAGVGVGVGVVDGVVVVVVVETVELGWGERLGDCDGWSDEGDSMWGIKLWATGVGMAKALASVANCLSLSNRLCLTPRARLLPTAVVTMGVKGIVVVVVVVVAVVVVFFIFFPLFFSFCLDS